MFDIEAIIAVFDRVLLDPLSLEAAFTELPRVTNARAAFMYSLVPGRPGLVGDQTAADMQRLYAEQGWMGSDLFTALAPTLAMDEVHVSDAFLPEQTARTNRFFTGYLSRWDIFRGAGWWFDLDGEPWVFCLARTEAQGHFTPDEIAALNGARARINWSFSALNKLAAGRTAAICDTLDMMAAPYVLLDHRGGVARVTESAAAMFDDDFGVQDTVLRASDARANELLQHVSVMARCGALGADIANIAPPHTIVIPRRDHRQPVVARPLRLRRAWYDVLPGAQIVLRLDDLDLSTLPSGDLLEAIFALTPREIEVARCIAGGHSSKAICAQLKLTRMYLQNLLSGIYLKTNTHSRQELVALLARVPHQA